MSKRSEALEADLRKRVLKLSLAINMVEFATMNVSAPKRAKSVAFQHLSILIGVSSETTKEDWALHRWAEKWWTDNIEPVLGESGAYSLEWEAVGWRQGEIRDKLFPMREELVKQQNEARSWASRAEERRDLHERFQKFYAQEKADGLRKN